MPIKERLGEELEDSLAEGVDDLDRAYLKELKKSGVSDSLLEQFRSMMIEQNEEEKENH